MTIAQQLKIKEFPFIVKDNRGKVIYREERDGYWFKGELDDKGKNIYYEQSNGYWEKREYDDKGNRIYYENSDGKIVDSRPKSVPEYTMEELTIDEAYENYCNKMVVNKRISIKDIGLLGFPSTQEEFINKCKTDPEFSEKWGLKIEERELSEEERWRIRFDYYPKDKQFPWDRMALPSHRFLDDFNIPTKLITVTRELSESEIWDYINKNKIEILHQHAVLYGHEVGSVLRKSFIPTLKENYNIPTKETIESYE